MRPVGWTQLLRSSETAVVRRRMCGNQWERWRRSGGDRRIRRTGTWEGVLCERWDSRRGSVRHVLLYRAQRGRVNARQARIGCNDWISWSNNYSVWPVIGRGKHTLGEESGSPFVPCCDFPARLLQVIVHTRHGFFAEMMTQRRSAKTNPSRVRISPV